MKLNKKHLKKIVDDIVNHGHDEGGWAVVITNGEHEIVSLDELDSRGITPDNLDQFVYVIGTSDSESFAEDTKVEILLDLMAEYEAYQEKLLSGKNPAAVALGKKSAKAREGKTDYSALARKRWDKEK